MSLYERVVKALRKAFGEWADGGRTTKAAIIFVAVAIGWFLATALWGALPVEVGHILLVVLVLSGLHLVAYSPIRRDIEEAVQRAFTRMIRFADGARRSDLIDVFESREAAREDIVDAIRTAERRVWILATTLSFQIRAAEIMPVLRDKAPTFEERTDEDRGVRLLLLNPLQSGAVHHMCLAATPSELASIVSTDRSETPANDPVFSQSLFLNHLQTCKALEGCPKVARNTKFYAQPPSQWIVICDDVAYVQDYIYCSGDDVASHWAEMPVHKYAGPHGKVSLLSKHFGRIWLTAHLDLFFVTAHRSDKDRIMRKLMRYKYQAIKDYYQLLSQSNGRGCVDRRSGPRRPCEASPLNLTYRGYPRGTAWHTARIIDISERGMLLDIGANPFVDVGERIELAHSAPVEPTAAKFMMDEFYRKCQYRLMVKRIGTNKEGRGTMGLSMES